MGKLSLIKILCICCALVTPWNGSAQFSDNFCDGDFLSNPTWIGDVYDFDISSEELHLNTEGAGTSYLTTTSLAIDGASWEFKVKLDFNPSSSNFVRVYLVSSESNLDGALNGYYVLIGGTQDHVTLSRQDGTLSTTIIDGQDKRVDLDEVNIKIKVTRDQLGNWELFSDTSITENKYISEGTTNDNNYTASTFFGVYAKYTSTRSDKVFFDNFTVTGPGQVDIEKPMICSFSITSEKTIVVIFNEPVSNESVQTLTNFSVNNGLGNPVSAEVNGNEVKLTFGNAFANNQDYELTIKGVEDNAGNEVEQVVETFTYLFIETPLQGDIVINEILFNPFTDGVDFVELYNNSNKVLSTDHLVVQEFNFEGIEIIDEAQLIGTSQLILPHSYVVLTSNTEAVLTFYSSPSPETFVEVSDMPNYPNAEGGVAIVDSAGNELDRLDYQENWHFVLLDDVDGVSLERVSFEATTQDRNNWKSAAQSVDYATPGYLNSTYTEVGLEDEITIAPEVFSPNSDGMDDIITIGYKLEKNGFVANAYIFDAKGREIIHLVKSETISQKGFWTWDGINENGEKAKVGIYIIYLELFDLNGDVRKYKEKFVLAADWN